MYSAVAYLETKGLRYKAYFPYPMEKRVKYSGQRMSGAKTQHRSGDLWSPFVSDLPCLETKCLRYEALFPYPMEKRVNIAVSECREQKRKNELTIKQTIDSL